MPQPVATSLGTPALVYGESTLTQTSAMNDGEWILAKGTLVIHVDFDSVIRGFFCYNVYCVYHAVTEGQYTSGKHDLKQCEMCCNHLSLI